MKFVHHFYILSAVFLAACAHSGSMSAPAGLMHRVTRDYAAIGDAAGIQPFVHGENTMIKVRKGISLTSTIVDDQGQVVSYTQQDGYYVLDRVLESFTVSGNGRSVKFERIQLPIQSIETEPIELGANSNMPLEAEVLTAQDAPTAVEAHAVKMNAPIFTVMKNQLAQQRELLDRASQNSKYTGSELSDIHSRLDFIESKMALETAVVHVHFALGKSTLMPGAELTSILIPAAREANKINLFGRTDSNVADKINAKIARSRALAVRSYLIAHGVPANKIEVSSSSAGNFIAPSFLKEGRALNRRVTIELVT
ncbi:MAG: OmpA family protein [Methylotenera sp.]